MKNSQKPNLWIFLIGILMLAQLTNSYAEDISLRDALDDKAIFILQHHKHAKTGSLDIVSADESRKNALNGKDRIAGYPIVGTLKDLDQEKSLLLANILLNESNYITTRIRCKNQAMHGIRFSIGDKKVEVIIGSPCNQAFVAFKHKNETKWWGSILSDIAMKKVLKLLAVGNLNK